MPFRVVLDTNVIISGLLFGGPPGAILDTILQGTVQLALSPTLLNEVEGVLRRKFPHAQQAIWDTLAILHKIALPVAPEERLSVITDDPSDNRVLECAIAGHADAIVSGDHHLQALKTFRGIPIFSPTDFLAHRSHKA